MKLKDHFTSRFGESGVLIEADWSGLEMVVWAFLNKDPMLYKLIKSGEDMHRYVGGRVLGCKPEEITDEQRSKLKPANFTLVYGGTDYNLVTKDGLDPEFAKSVYDNFWNAFPVARLWTDNLMKILDANAYKIDEYTKKGNPRYQSWYQGITGRKFFFKSYDFTDFTVENRIHSKKGFKYAEGMNYKVQSFATADIHMIALGILFRQAMKHRDKFLLINTVHDSCLIDCKKEYLDFTLQLAKDALESVIDRLDNVFDIKFDLPLKAEFKVGNSWSTMKKYSINEVK